MTKNVKRRNDMETLETNGTQFHRKYNQNWHLQFFFARIQSDTG